MTSAGPALSDAIPGRRLLSGRMSITIPSDRNSSRTAATERGAIEAGNTGDKVAGFDPSASPMETDAEAGGTATVPDTSPLPKPGEEISSNASSHGPAMRASEGDHMDQGDGRSSSSSPLSPPSSWRPFSLDRRQAKRTLVLGHLGTNPGLQRFRSFLRPNCCPLAPVLQRRSQFHIFKKLVCP